jgi:hypothetical protein
MSYPGALTFPGVPSDVAPPSPKSAPLPIGVSSQPFYVRERKDWAVQQEIYRHDQAMYAVGESAMFVLMWTVEDHQAGYVSRCQRCFLGDDLAARTAAVYQQATQNKCPECYGTTFMGGVRAKIVRPAIFTDSDDEEKRGAKGVTHPQNVSIESTNDFRFRAGDYVFRVDGSRWQLTTPTRVTLRTGFDHPTQKGDSIGYARAMGSLEDETSVAYIIPPNGDTLSQILQSPSRYPGN